MKTSWICGLVVVLTALPVWGKELPPALQVAVDAANIRDSRMQLTPLQGDQLHEVARLLSAEKIEDALVLWEDILVELIESGVPRDFVALELWLLRRAYIETDPELKRTADSLRFFTALETSIGREIRLTEDLLLELFDKDDIATLNDLIADLELARATAEIERAIAEQKFKEAIETRRAVRDLIRKIRRRLEDIVAKRLRAICLILGTC